MALLFLRPAFAFSGNLNQSYVYAAETKLPVRLGEGLVLLERYITSNVSPFGLSLLLLILALYIPFLKSLSLTPTLLSLPHLFFSCFLSVHFIS